MNRQLQQLLAGDTEEDTALGVETEKDSRKDGLEEILQLYQDQFGAQRNSKNLGSDLMLGLIPSR